MNRTHRELLGRLSEHCAILEDFHQKACREGQVRYLGEVAGKLRVLVHRSRSNRPLLLDLMAEMGAHVPITIDGPSGGRQTDLPSYLAERACAIQLPSGELAELSNSDLIALWSQQSGAAHEDWALDKPLQRARRGKVSREGGVVEAAACGWALDGRCGPKRNADGSITVPEVLVPYMGKERIGG